MYQNKPRFHVGMTSHLLAAVVLVVAWQFASVTAAAGDGDELDSGANNGSSAVVCATETQERDQGVAVQWASYQGRGGGKGNRGGGGNAARQLLQQQARQQLKEAAQLKDAARLRDAAQQFEIGRGQLLDQTRARDQSVIHQLLAAHDKIDREVELRDDGVETLTESDDPQVAKLIQTHVEQMKERVEKVKPIRMRDPLFAAIFQNAAAIKFEYEKTEKGVRVVETSDNPMVVKLIQAHAQVVSLFVENGMAEARQSHSVPK